MDFICFDLYPQLEIDCVTLRSVYFKQNSFIFDLRTGVFPGDFTMTIRRRGAFRCKYR